ncbi:hypothetical protein ACFE04_025926 [Oxalis oulophora]
MGGQRRRQQQQVVVNNSNKKGFRRIFSLISVISCALLIFFLLLSSHAPSIHHHHQRHSTLRFDLLQDAPPSTPPPPVFRVPGDGGSLLLDHDIWTSKLSNFYHPCTNASSKFLKADTMTVSNRYLMIVTSGGLNQQRTGITDAVVAARILNATLVVPKLDQKSYWKDSSNFAEIFDVDWFISFLSKDVKIIKHLPKKGGKTWTSRNMRVPRKCNERCYQNRVLPVLLKRHVVQLSKFDYRLSNRLDPELQKLRCRVNYHALRFTDPILEMGKKLVHRMRMKSKHFIALHLRFEPDMLAFSGCDYGGGDKERKELGAIRRRWKTLHAKNPEKERRHGKCPLTPEEVGLMLRALGYGSDVNIYVASGEVYGGEETLAPLKQLFPNFYSKDSVASREELEPFSKFSSRMAALDFIVCDESNVFVTNNNGNMAKILAGRRRYNGHKPTIRPNSKKLYKLFLNRNNMTWEEFTSQVRSFQRGFMGAPLEVKPGRGGFHENPSTCICEDSEAKSAAETRKHSKELDVNLISEDENNEDEPEWPDAEDDDDQNGLEEKGLYNVTNIDYEVPNSEEPELDEILSD